MIVDYNIISTYLKNVLNLETNRLNCNLLDVYINIIKINHTKSKWVFESTAK